MNRLAEPLRIGAWQTPRRLGRYRYRLGFEVDPAGCGRMLVIGLNPSTASLTTTDPTVDSFCRGFARAAGCRELEMCNLFGLRSTDKLGLLAVRDPVGPGHDRHLAAALRSADRVLLAWGAHFHPIVATRAEAVVRLITRHAGGPLYVIGWNRDGSPRHPLYQPIRKPLVAVDSPRARIKFQGERS